MDEHNILPDLKQFPMDFKVCPVCGESQRMADSVLQDLKDQNKARKELQAFLFQHLGMIHDPAKTTLTVPVIATFFDACVNCGTVYCVHAEVRQGTPKSSIHPPSSGLIRGN
ncbi:MAG: hypothetical protein WC364_05750 [Eubacteriales bacterium]|jgi:hypothetical protein